MTTVPNDGRIVAFNPTMPLAPVTRNGAACTHPDGDVVLLSWESVTTGDLVVWCQDCGSISLGPSEGRIWQAPTGFAILPVALPSVLPSTTPPLAPHIAALVAANQGIFLDVGCSDHKSPGSIGMDIRAVAGVDIVHDLESFPWPLPDGCAKRILCSHLIEHIKPWLTVHFINECWRVMQANGQLILATPYAGSPRFWQDPTHIHGWMEATPLYFTPGHPLYEVYRPKPWKLELNEYASVGDLNVILAKLPEEGEDASR